MHEVKLGKLIDETGQRDAIHVAIAPVVANESLEPGQHVGLNEEGKATNKTENPIGIVDPFLKERVPKGFRFYLCLYPNTVTSLRHHWSHYAFKEDSATANLDDLAKSELWLRMYAEKVNRYDKPDAAFVRLIEGLTTGEMYFKGSDLHGRYDIPDEDGLRFHAERYLNKEINFELFTFSCSC
jgi:hypothetical protein